MLLFIEGIEKANRGLGRFVSWCALGMMLCQVFAVVARYVFSYGIISVQEAVVYGHALLFLLGSACLLQFNQHVRVDIFYQWFSPKSRRVIDLLSMLLFILPVVAVIAWVGFPYVVRSWETLEGSRQAGGLPAIFLLKTAILVFAGTLFLQALATTLRLVFHLSEPHWHNDETEAH